MTEEPKQGAAAAAPAPEPKKPARVIKSSDNRPCGCSVVEFSDGGRVYSPCVACGLYATAEHLQQASQALAAVATRMQQTKSNDIMQRAAAAAAEASARKVVL